MHFFRGGVWIGERPTHSDWKAISREVSDDTFRMMASQQWPRKALAHGEIGQEVGICCRHDGFRADDGQTEDWPDWGRASDNPPGMIAAHLNSGIWPS
jgi:hypothetical protein